jgi:outer membrane protein W
MGALLLALLTTASTPSSEVAVLPVQGSLEAAQAAALQRLLGSELARGRGLEGRFEAPPSGGAEPCLDAACLGRHAQGARHAISLSLVPFGTSTVATLTVWHASQPAGVLSAARTAASPDQLPGVVSALVEEVWPRTSATAEGSPEAGDEPWSPSLGFNLKVGNVLPAIAGTKLQLSAINPRLDFELDYFAVPSFLPFIDASVVLGSNGSGQGVQLVPVLLGAKYLFREGHSLRPYLGVGLGLGFLSGALSGDAAASTSFAIYSVGGVAVFPWERVGLNLETSLNLSGLQVSAQSGVLFAFSASLGVVFLF